MHRLIEKAREEHSLDKDELIELLCGGEETDAETRQHEPRPPRGGWARARGRPG